MNILVLNVGSSSVKYGLFALPTEATLAAGTIERVGTEKTHVEAIRGVLASLGDVTVDAVGHRVVHGGEQLNDSVAIDDTVLVGIEACVPLAPLHNPVNLAGIRAAREVLPNVPHVAVFDTAFHHSLPRRSRTYAIDQKLAERHGIRRYGFHGCSHAFIAAEAARHLKRPLEQLRLISCHLGSGASVCAIEAGHSVETSMGMTPLEGLVMGTRGGDIDPGALLALLRAEGWGPKELDDLLNKKSGLLGLSGISNDLRDLEEKAAAGEDGARLAIAVFAHRVRKYIGAYAAVMGGVDAVLLTGGIGENGVAMRQRMLQRLEFMGLFFDEERNQSARVSDTARVAEVQASHSAVKALVIATDEELYIAREAAKVAQGHKEVRAARPIPIGVSARHVHLCQATLEQLFGPGAVLTERNPLSQPGQFAANETVNVIGPRRRLDNVRILGPLRPADQIEISRTDEFFLGVDAPVRLSGNTKGSAPITLEGPRGQVHLPEGLICAWRHIHMAPADAEEFGVKDGDEVAVSIKGGVRDLLFGDVMIRVNKQFVLEMHVDTDEANAAELGQSASGDFFLLDGAVAGLVSKR